MRRSITIDDLLAREAITDVIKRYVRGVDRADAALIRSCYHDDAIDDHGTFVGPPDAFAEFVAGERSGRYEATMHFLAGPNIVDRGDVADVDTYCIAHQITTPDGDGRQVDVVVGLRYVDRFERRRGEWRIARRTAVFDWTYTVPIEPDLTRPFVEAAQRGSRDGSDPWYELTGVRPPARGR